MNLFHPNFESQPLIDYSVRWPYLNFLAEFICQTLTLLLIVKTLLCTQKGEYIGLAYLWWAIAATGTVRMLYCTVNWKLILLELGAGGAGLAYYHLYQDYMRALVHISL